ncbi:MAG: hypothetical protein K2J46_00700, partial [Muribaculaceae bacterium]|nr:hypothetical protein [Muribaculaceae bacterium]
FCMQKSAFDLYYCLVVEESCKRSSNYLDPNPSSTPAIPNLTVIPEPATKGVQTLARLLKMDDKR